MGILLVTWRLADLLISVIAPFFIPYLGFFSYGHDMYQYGMPYFIRALTNFDGIFYIRIAINGYAETEQAYFPLYSLLIREVDTVIQNPIITGVLISNLCFLGGYIIFNKYIRLLVKPHVALWVVLFLLAYPSSYYFGVMYNEGLFFLLLVSSLFFFKKEKLLPAFITAYLIGLTKVIGMFLCVSLGIMLLGRLFTLKPFSLKKAIQKYWKHALVCAAPVLGMATYALYLLLTTGDALYFFHAQEDFGANRSSHLITPPQVVYRYIKIFMTADKSFQYYVAVSELSFYVFALSVLTYDLITLLRQKIKNFDRLALNAFSFINVIVPSLTGTLTAVPRYTLMSLSIFFVLAEIKNKTVKYILLGIFILLHIAIYALFIQGYYVT